MAIDYVTIPGACDDGDLALWMINAITAHALAPQ